MDKLTVTIEIGTALVFHSDRLKGVTGYICKTCCDYEGILEDALFNRNGELCCASCGSYGDALKLIVEE